TWKDAYYYQFRADLLTVAGELTHARIEYEVDSRTLHSETFIFRLAAGEKLTVVVPDPSRVIALGDPKDVSAGVKINVYAGDMLLDSFDLASFQAYNEQLRRTESAELRYIFDSSLRDLEDSPASPALREKLSSQTEPGLKVADDCAMSCEQEYYS